MAYATVAGGLRWRSFGLEKEVIYLREYIFGFISRKTLLGFWLNCGEWGELFISWVDFYSGGCFFEIEDKQAIDYIYAGIPHLVCVWELFRAKCRLYRVAVDLFPLFDFSKYSFYLLDRALLRRNVLSMYSRAYRRKWPYLRCSKKLIFFLYKRFVYCNSFNTFFRFLVFSL